MAKLEMFRNQENIESFSAHDTIFSKGDPRTVMYVIKEGEVEIRLGDTLLEVVGVDGIFGEMAMVDGQPPVWPTGVLPSRLRQKPSRLVSRQKRRERML